jgi:hypothetical protein
MFFLVVGSLWSLFWGVLTLAAWSFGGDTTGWVIAGAALAAGALVCFYGFCLVREG